MAMFLNWLKSCAPNDHYHRLIDYKLLSVIMINDFFKLCNEALKCRLILQLCSLPPMVF